MQIQNTEILFIIAVWPANSCHTKGPAAEFCTLQRTLCDMETELPTQIFTRSVQPAAWEKARLQSLAGKL